MKLKGLYEKIVYLLDRNNIMKILKKEILNTHLDLKILNKIKELKTIKIVYNIFRKNIFKTFEYLYPFKS